MTTVVESSLDSFSKDAAATTSTTPTSSSGHATAANSRGNTPTDKGHALPPTATTTMSQPSDQKLATTTTAALSPTAGAAATRTTTTTTQPPVGPNPLETAALGAPITPAAAAASDAATPTGKTIPALKRMPTTIEEREAGMNIAGQYSCIYGGVSGTLYAGNKALYFVGTYFLFEKKVTLPWENTRQVIKLDQGVQIWTKREELHTFTAIQQPSRVWPVLMSLHNDALLDPSTTSSSSSNAASDKTSSVSQARSMKRRNSDPAAMKSSMFITNIEDDDPTETNDEDSKILVVGTTTQPGTDTLKKGVASCSLSSKLAAFPVAGLTAQEVQDNLGEVKLQPIACTYDQNVQGTLYAGLKGLYFYGKRYFWDVRKLHFPFGSLKQCHMVSDQEGISITDKNGQVYLFAKMENPDKVWASFIALHNEILLGSSDPKHSGSGTMFRGSVIRMNSDPNLSVMRLAVEDKPAPQEVSSPSPTAPPRTCRGFQMTRTPTTKSSESSSSSSAEQQKQQTPQSGVSVKQEWDKCVAEKTKYRNLVVEQLVLKCSLDDFVAKFLANGAPYSIAKYLESRGDSSLRASEWNATTTTSAATPRQVAQPQRRVIHYKHPVNAPLAPPQAGARKEQTLKRYGDHGLCLETRTIVADVPMADCFHVDDRIRVEQQNAAAGSAPSVTVYMEFEITFIKSTMFKGIIERTAKSEFTDFFKQMGGYLSNALGEEVPILPTPKEPEPVAAKPSLLSTLRGGAGSVGVSVNPILLLLVLCVQCYIVRELLAIKGALLRVQSQQKQLLSPQSFLSTAACNGATMPSKMSHDNDPGRQERH
ncbi:hypothetical protein ACA910_013696 [Epithemia clementina (nom. ined.)]